MIIEEVLASLPVADWQIGSIYSFGWYDGPRAGVCAFRVPEVECAFDLVAERYNPDGLDDRLFRLSDLPPGSVLGVLSAVPLLASHDAIACQRARATIATIEASKRPTSVIVHTQDWQHFLGCWQVPPAERNGVDWFAFLGIPKREFHSS